MFSFKKIIVFSVLSVVVFISCTKKEEATATSGYIYSPLAQSNCDYVQNLSSGYLCAIKPSRLEATAKDKAGASGLDALYGFGYHAIAFPLASIPIKGFYIHFTGTYGRPFNQDDNSFDSRVFLNEAMESGYIVIQLAYDNRESVNFDLCPNGTMIDDCAGQVRLEKISGIDHSSIISTNLADGIENRLVKLIGFLSSNGFNLPTNIISGNQVVWSEVNVSGHSQGGGIAYYIAKNFGAARACMLASPYDSPDGVNASAPTIADWFKTATAMTALTHLRGLVSTDDSSYAAFTGAYSYIGLVQNTHWKNFSGSPYADDLGSTIDGHAAVMKDTRFKTERQWACFDSLQL